MARSSCRFAFLPLALALAACPQPSAASGFVAITHVTVIDATGAPPRPDSTVLARDDRIVEIGPTDRVRVPSSSRIVEGRGKYLIPGLWDMHVHISPSLGGVSILPVFTAYGVTGIRDAGSEESIFIWQEDIAQGRRVGPRIVAAGRYIGTSLDQEDADKYGGETVRSAEAAKAAVARRRARAQYAKAQDGFMPPSLWLAVAEGARNHRLPLAGHPPVAIPLTEAIAHGLRSIEHTFGLALAFTEEESRLRRRVMATQGDYGEKWRALCEADVEALGALDQSRLQAVAESMAEMGVALVPTLTDLRAMATTSSGRWNDDARMSYLPPSIQAAWRTESSGSFLNPVTTAAIQSLYRQMPSIIDSLHDAGVRVLAGTDAGAPFDFPGSDLHSELAQLVAAGLTPMEALQTATLNPAEFMEMTDSIGTIQAGRSADLVLLNADPLLDINNTTRIAGVMQAGRFFPEAELKSMLAAVRHQHR